MNKVKDNNKGFMEDKENQEIGIRKEEGSFHFSQTSRRGEESTLEEIANFMNQIEEEMMRIEQRLAEIKSALAKIDQTSENYSILSEQRRALRKELIQYDDQHEKLFRQYKQSQEQKTEKSEQKEAQYRRLQQQRQQKRLERSKRLEEQLENIKRESQQRRECITKLSTKRDQEIIVQKKKEYQDEEIKEKVQEEVSQKGQERENERQSEAEIEEEEMEACQKARVEEIDQQLATDNLRRSRQRQLYAELMHLRTENPNSSWLKRFPYSSRVFSYPLNPPLLHSSSKYSTNLTNHLLCSYPKYSL